jgi:hypothetical protein
LPSPSPTKCLFYLKSYKKPCWDKEIRKNCGELAKKRNLLKILNNYRYDLNKEMWFWWGATIKFIKETDQMI